MVDMKEIGSRSYVPEPDRGKRNWEGKEEARDAVYANRRRTKGKRGKALMRKRGEMIERTFAHAYETGGLRRIYLRGRENILKRLLIHIAALNLGVLMRHLFGAGTPRGFADLNAALRAILSLLIRAIMAIFAAMTPPRGCYHDSGAWRRDRRVRCPQSATVEIRG